MGQQKSSLHKAAVRGDVKKLRRQLRSANTATVNTVKDGKTALFLATQRQQLEAVQELLKHNADVNIICEFTEVQGEKQRTFNWTVVHEVCRSGSLPLLQLLLDHGGDANVRAHDGITPLHVAAWHGYINIIDALISKGCDVNKLDHFQESAIVLPIYRGDIKMVEYLLKARCKLNSRSWSSRSARSQSEIYFSECEENSNAYLYGPHTLFTHAVQCGWINIAILLLQHGFNYNKYEIKDVLRICANTGLTEEDVWPLIKTIFSAGYIMKHQDEQALRDNRYYQKYVRKYDSICDWMRSEIGAVLSLKVTAMIVIRNRLRAHNVGFSVFELIEKLPIPAQLKNFLKLRHINVDYPEVEPETYPFYFGMHKRILVEYQQHPYILFWKSVCNCNR